MSDATRAVALREAMILNHDVSETSPKQIVADAEVFNAFLTADSTPQASQPAVTSAAGKEPAAPAKPTKGSVSRAKPASKLVPEDESETPEGKQIAKFNAKAAADAAKAAAAEAEAETAEESEEEETEDETEEDDVKAIIAQLLEKNLRKEAVTLLKKYKAASATSVKPSDYAKFIADAKKLLPADEESEDLTA